MNIEEFRAHFQPYLEQFVAEKRASCAVPPLEKEVSALLDYPHTMARGNAKRIRPYGAFLAGALGKGEAEYSWFRVLASLELFHLFCLLHDDVIDEGDERYGLPTVQKWARENLTGEASCEVANRVGNAHAMLLGNLVFAWSQELFYETDGFCETRWQRARPLFQAMVREVVIGQMMDVQMMTRAATSLRSIEEKMRLKTASYTFIRPLQIGSALAGGDDKDAQFCADFGLALGLAFQMQDDLLDLVGSRSAMKKTVLCDLREHQHTYFTQFIFEHGNASQKRELQCLMGRELSEDDRPRVVELFERSGALARGRLLIDEHLSRACELLQQSPWPRPSRDGWAHLVDTLRARDFSPSS